MRRRACGGPYRAPSVGAAAAARHDRFIELCAAGDAESAAALAEEIWQALVIDASPTDPRHEETP